MRWIVFGMLVVICLLMVMCYALMVIAHEADERAEQALRMYRTAVQQAEKIYKEQKEKKDDDN